MFQLTQHCPPELRSNSRRMQSILQARKWDAQSIFDSDVSCQVMLPGQGTPRLTPQARYGIIGVNPGGEAPSAYRGGI